MAKLICVFGNNQGEEFPVCEGVTGIGRSNVCTVFLRDAKCSRMHCSIHKKGRQFQVEDMGSANGTQVDGKSLKRGEFVPIKYGGTIQLGETRLLFSDGDSAAPAPTKDGASGSSTAAGFDKTASFGMSSGEASRLSYNSGIDLSRGANKEALKLALIREQELRISADRSPISRAIKLAVFRLRCSLFGPPQAPAKKTPPAARGTQK